jgi:adenine phosphoribosyltransferase
MIKKSHSTIKPINLKEFIRDVPDFPKKGVVFKDINPLLRHPDAFHYLINLWYSRYEKKNIEAILAVESRGFIFSSALALILKVPLVLIRKPGKLPSNTIQEKYDLEYGTDALEIQVDALPKKANVLILDDVLATGGTAAGVVRLANRVGAHVFEVTFLIELTFLNGRQKLQTSSVYSILQY